MKRAVFALQASSSLGFHSQQGGCSTVVAHFEAEVCSSGPHILQWQNKQNVDETHTHMSEGNSVIVLNSKT